MNRLPQPTDPAATAIPPLSRNTNAAAPEIRKRLSPPARSFRARSPSQITINTDPEVLRSGYHHTISNCPSSSSTQRPGLSRPTLEDTAAFADATGVVTALEGSRTSRASSTSPFAGTLAPTAHGDFLSPDLRRTGSSSPRQRPRSRHDASPRKGSGLRQGTTSSEWSAEDQHDPSRSSSSRPQHHHHHHYYRHRGHGGSPTSSQSRSDKSSNSPAQSSISASTPCASRPRQWHSDLELTSSPTSPKRRRLSHKQRQARHHGFPELSPRPGSQMSLSNAKPTSTPSSPIRSIFSRASIRRSSAVENGNTLEGGNNRRSFSLRRFIRGNIHKDEEAANEDAGVNDEGTTVISRHMSSYRVVHLLYQTDADLFDAIQEWKEAHPERWVDDAIDAFSEAKGADALAQLVYSTEAFDIILKYTASPEDIAPIFSGYSDKSKHQETPTSPLAPSPLSKDTMNRGGNIPSIADEKSNKGVLAVSQGLAVEDTNAIPEHQENSFKEASTVGFTSPFEHDQPSSVETPLGTSKDKRPRSRLLDFRETPQRLLRRAFSLGSGTNTSPSVSSATKQPQRSNTLNIGSSNPKASLVDVKLPSSLEIPPIPRMEPIELPGSQHAEIDSPETGILPSSMRAPGSGLSSSVNIASVLMDDDGGTPLATAAKPSRLRVQESFQAQEHPTTSSGSHNVSGEARPHPARKSSGFAGGTPSSSVRRRRLKKKRRTKIQRERPSKARMREWKIQLHRRQYQLALLREGLFIELEKSIHSDAVYVKVLAPFWRLLDEAQKTMCKADLANTLLPSIPFSSRLFPSIGRFLPFLLKSGLEQSRETVLFKKSRLHEYHLAEATRRWSDVVRHSCAVDPSGRHAGGGCGSDGRPGFFLTSRRGYLVNSIMMRTETRRSPTNRKLGLRSALRRGAYQKLFALHDGPVKLQGLPIHQANIRAQLHQKWAKRFCGGNPLDLVVNYYGERIGVYFAWWAHYTRWLSIPATVGLVVFIFGLINAANRNQLDASPNVLFAIFDNVLTMPFALFMSLWSTVYIEFWKRANKFYAYRWHMLDYERVELPRTEFRATRVRTSPVTGKKEMYYPLYWKALRFLGSSIATLIAIAVVVGCVATLMIFTAWCRNHISAPYGAVVAAAILNLIIIIVLGEIWCRLAEWLTDKENHKYTDSYEDSLIMKRYLFDFTNMYGTLFYYAFFKAPFGTKVFSGHPDLQDKCLYDACITELSLQLAVVFIGKQFLNGMFEMVFPWIKTTWSRKRILADQALKRKEWLDRRKLTRTPQWIKDDDLPSYDSRILKCYRKTVIQFGFCTLFVTSFPLAPAFALLNNLVDMRMEAFRLLTQYRRPIAFRAQDIGMWEKIMEFISFTSVITNAAIIAFSSLWIKQNLFINYLHATTEGELLAARLGFILVFEHVVFLFKIILRAAIPTVPLPIKLAVQRSKYMSRVANEGLDSEQDEDLDETDSEGDETYLSDEESSDAGIDDLGDRPSAASSEIDSSDFESSSGSFDPQCPECREASSKSTPRTTTDAATNNGSGGCVAPINILSPHQTKGRPNLFSWGRKKTRRSDTDRNAGLSALSEKQPDTLGKRPYRHCAHHHQRHQRPQIQHQQYSIPTISEERSLFTEDRSAVVTRPPLHASSSEVDNGWTMLNSWKQFA